MPLLKTHTEFQKHHFKFKLLHMFISHLDIFQHSPLCFLWLISFLFTGKDIMSDPVQLLLCRAALGDCHILPLPFHISTKTETWPFCSFLYIFIK